MRVGIGGRRHDFVCHLKIGRILAWVGGLVLEELKSAVSTIGQEGAHARAQPVDPMVAWEAGHHVWSEGAGRVDAGASVVGAADVCNKDRDANADGRKVG